MREKKPWVGDMENPLFTDPIYRRCMELATASPCQKMGFGAVMITAGEIVAQSPNRTIEELSSMCDPACIRFEITSRTESMLGACGHAEEWVLKETRDQGIDPADCDLYVAGIKADGEPYIKTQPEHTCLRCSVQMHSAALQSVQVPVIDRWVGISTAQALQTAKDYALKSKEV
jgi:deoxycytidylate deaminase